MKKYKYNNKIYCEEDLSEEIGDEYGGDLFWLYFALKDDGKADEYTCYQTPDCPEKIYDSAEELIEKQFEHLVVED